MRATNKLTAVKIAKLKEPGRYGDGGGLWLQVSQWETKAWLFRFMRAGQARQMGLGPYPDVSLAEARDLAAAARRSLRDGIDPIEARRQRIELAKAEVAKRITFKEAADRYVAAHRAGWRNPKHGEQWVNTLSTYAFPFIGSLSVAAVDTGHVLKVLEPIWTTKTETASRVRGRIEAVLDWSTARSYRQGENPARWRGHLDKLLPAKTKVARVSHHDALPYGDVPAFMARLRDMESVSARALEFTILTAARTGEAIGARWPEIDLKVGVWTVPGDRMKAGREHRVPLSDRVVEILAAMPREGKGDGFIFPGAKAGKSLSNMAMLELVRGVQPGVTVHGFRSSFKDWASEQTNYPTDVAEAALAHIISDKTQAAYQRGDLLEKRRRLMAAWAGYCGKTPAARGEVVTLRSAVAS